jgi:RNA polymerase sigma factor (sigma-70 family)
MANDTLTPLVRRLRRTAEPADGGVTDRQLLARFVARRDEAAFAALVRRHGRLVLAACRRVLGEAADVEDAFQSTFLVLVRKAASVNWERSVGPWLFCVAHREAVRARTLARRRREREAQVAGRSEAAAPDLSWREACDLLHRELDRLPDKYRLPLLACYLEGRSRDEAAAQLGWTAGTLKGRLERGRLLLRDRLARRGVTLSVGFLAAVAAPASAEPLPSVLVDSTVQAALSPRPAGTAAALAALLARGAPRTMTTTRRIALVTALSAVALIALAAGGWTRPTPADPPPAAPAAAPAADKAPATVTVSGQVLSPDGKPFAGAKVSLPLITAAMDEKIADEEELIKRLDWSVRATTDADGRFRFTAPWPAGVRFTSVTATADGYGFDGVTQHDPKPDSFSDLTLRLAKDDVPVKGRVLDTEGRPVPGATALLMSVEIPPNGDLSAYLAEYRRLVPLTYGKNCYLTPPPALAKPVKTDADGRFELRGVGRDRIAVVQIKGPGVETAVLRVLTRPGVDAASLPQPGGKPGGNHADQPSYGPEFNHVALPVQAVSGTVRERGTGKPVAGVSVWGHAIGRSGDAQAVTDAQGRYRLVGLPKAGQRRLILTPAADQPYLWAARELPDDPGLAAQTADFELTRGVVVTGRIYDKATGKPAEGSLGYVPLPDNKHFKDIPDPSGKYESLDRSSRPDGTYRLVVMPGSGIITVQAHDNRYRPAPVPEPAEGQAPITPRDGGFPSAYGHYAFISGCNAARMINPAPGTEAMTVDLPLDPGRSLAGRVVGPDGQPLGGATLTGLTATWSRPQELPGAELTILSLAPPEPRVLAGWHLGRKLAGALTVRGDEPAPVLLKLQPAGSLVGRVVDAEGRPVAGAHLAYGYRDDKGKEMNLFNANTELPPTTTGPDGRFRIEGLVPGLGARVRIYGVEKGDKFLRTAKGKGVLAVRSGATDDVGDLTVAPVEN